MTGLFTKSLLRTLDRILPARGAAHLLTGTRGEEEAYFYLRQLGYVMVAGEAAVDDDKQRELSGMARDYLRRVQPMPAVRFDVLSIYVEAGGGVGDMTLFK